MANILTFTTADFYKFSVFQVFFSVLTKAFLMARNVPKFKFVKFSNFYFLIFKFCDFNLSQTSINKRNTLRLQKHCLDCNHFKSTEIKSFKIIMASFIQYIHYEKVRKIVPVSLLHVLFRLLAHMGLCFLGPVFQR